MKMTRTGKRRAAAISSVKILLTSASLAATLGGWAAISAANGSALQVAAAGAGVDATATVQSWLDSRSTTAAASSAAPAADTTQSGAAQGSTGAAAATTAATTAATATVAPTATAVPTQVTIQPTIRTRSSK